MGARDILPHVGFTVFLTGLSGAGKSTTATALQEALTQCGMRSVELLDGDEVRKMGSSDLGFSRTDRDTNIRRIGHLALNTTGRGGACICAAIAPYDATRKEVRAMIEPHGGFFLVHIATPLEICESRDAKGLYAKARLGELSRFTGISDPYQVPDDADIVVDCSITSPREAAGIIVRHLQSCGYLW